jgi:hypothetical protein
VADEGSSKAAFRQWAREHHPDVGGDPELFAAGLRAMREGRWEQFLAGRADEPQPPAPTRTQVYVRRSARGVVKLYVAARRWNDKRRTPPRVQ